MEPFQIIVGVGALMAFAIPVLYLRQLEIKKNRVLTAYFFDLASKNKLNIKEYEYWNVCYCIGIDPEQNKLFYLKHKGERDDVNLIDLDKVERCSLTKLTNQVKTPSGTSTIVIGK